MKIPQYEKSYGSRHFQVYGMSAFLLCGSCSAFLWMILSPRISNIYLMAAILVLQFSASSFILISADDMLAWYINKTFNLDVDKTKLYNYLFYIYTALLSIILGNYLAATSVMKSCLAVVFFLLLLLAAFQVPGNLIKTYKNMPSKSR